MGKPKIVSAVIGGTAEVAASPASNAFNGDLVTTKATAFA
jgi:hypothetical protein